ncbi:MAG: hypothetical protein ACI86H_002597 [bacterium]|jgi:hypothetical protein
MSTKKSIHTYMRSLHRDIGFLIIGLTLIYSISGILFIYRETDFLKQEQFLKRIISKNLKAHELGRALHNKKIRAVNTEKGIIFFKNGKYSGTYNKLTGEAIYKSKELPFLLEKVNSLHKSTNKGVRYWFTTLYGLLLAFLAISSFWMYKPKTKNFKRGISLTMVGVLIAIALVAL